MFRVLGLVRFVFCVLGFGFWVSGGQGLGFGGWCLVFGVWSL